jgi:hypothetical protein
MSTGVVDVHVNRPIRPDLHAVPERQDLAPRAPGPANKERPDGPASVYHADAAHQAYVQKALAAEQVDHQAVAEARKLLASGQLDTPEAADRAAEAILRLDI